MPDWILMLFSGMLLLILLAGVLNFPYVPMLLGVYGGVMQTIRGKLIFKLLWLFPVVTLASIIFSWVSDPLYVTVPFLYLMALWIVRANKGASSGLSRQYVTKEDNLTARLDELEYRRNSWDELSPNNAYVLYRLFAPDEGSVNNIINEVKKIEVLCGEVEINSYKNKTFSVYVPIKIGSIDFHDIKNLTEKMVNTA